MKYAVSIMAGLTLLGWLPSWVLMGTIWEDDGAVIGLPIILWPCLAFCTAFGGWSIVRRGQVEPMRHAVVGVLLASASIVIALTLPFGTWALVVRDWDLLATALLAPLMTMVGSLPGSVSGAAIGVAIGQKGDAPMSVHE